MTRGISNWYESENCVNLKSLKNRKNKKERTEVRSSQSRRKETEAVSFTSVFIIRKTPCKVKGFVRKTSEILKCTRVGICLCAEYPIAFMQKARDRRILPKSQNIARCRMTASAAPRTAWKSPCNIPSSDISDQTTGLVPSFSNSLPDCALPECSSRSLWPVVFLSYCFSLKCFSLALPELSWLYTTL